MSEQIEKQDIINFNELNVPENVNKGDFRDYVSNLISDNKLHKARYSNYPSLPRVFHLRSDGTYLLRELKLKDGTPNRGHTMSVITGYLSRCTKFINNRNLES